MIALSSALGLSGAGAAEADLGAARALQAKILTVDTHIDILDGFATDAFDPGRFTHGQVDLPKLRAGGLKAPFFIVYTAQGPLTEAGYAAAKATANEKLEAILRLTRAYPAEIALARTSAEARAIAKSGRLVAFIGMENPYPLGLSVADLPRFVAAGVSYVGLTHFGHNQFGDSANPSTELGDGEEKWGGLSPLGKELVAAINRAGALIDVSHAGRKTMMQAVALSKAPVIASHSAIRALADAARNLDDEQLRALAATGGVAQIVAVDTYLKPLTPAQITAQGIIRKEMGLETSAARDAMNPETAKAYKARLTREVYSTAPRASVKDLIDHVDYAVKLVGVDHVGIASDFDGGGGIDGWDDASETANVTAELLRRGYSADDIAKLWGGNVLRALDTAQAVGARLRK